MLILFDNEVRKYFYYSNVRVGVTKIITQLNTGFEMLKTEWKRENNGLQQVTESGSSGSKTIWPIEKFCVYFDWS